uniref:PPPDE domain-containing protein n=1 Tax=Chromera velia CCMP2878 TaxID=1169474 RepID=A0A0G4HZS5_9ALVE|eukprot:Cvel_9793.t1-p1 / transcript=Cvel_9793.t1 / gene=Cvel_9793 / organism=Chromera_velia_CCMP2878 / gene_product=hypothetical protein / transcript_product=hypothetical protein / location=Cvel_scaffold574:65573-73250(+) / protein_length=1148 / sequence_SO=supercontig / SO=protein_coding / is_pseudo=false
MKGVTPFVPFLLVLTLFEVTSLRLNGHDALLNSNDKSDSPKDSISNELDAIKEAEKRLNNQVIWKCPLGNTRLEKMAVGCVPISKFAYHCATFATFTLKEDSPEMAMDYPGKHVLMMELLGDYHTSDAIVHCDYRKVPKNLEAETKENLDEYISWGNTFTNLEVAMENEWTLEKTGGWTDVLPEFKGAKQAKKLPKSPGVTTLSNMRQWIRNYIRRHNKYEVLRDNCQKFATQSYRAGTGSKYSVKQCYGAAVARWVVGPSADNKLSRLAQKAVVKSLESKKAAISELAFDKSGFGSAWLLLDFIKKGRLQLPLQSLDLSGPHVCKDACLPVLLGFLQQLKGEAPLICLKTLNLASNHLCIGSVQNLGSVLASGSLPNLLSLDLSENPLSLSGFRALAKGLSSSPQSLPLQSLKLSRTKAKAEGVEALAEALKAKKTTSLQTLDLADNEIGAGGFKHLVSAINTNSVPNLQVLILRNNRLTDLPNRQKDYSPLTELLSTNALKQLEALDASANCLFDAESGGVDEGEEGAAAEVSAAALLVPGRFLKLRQLNLGRFPSTMSASQLAAFATGLGMEGAPNLQELSLPLDSSLWESTTEGVVGLANSISLGHLSELTGLKIPYRRDLLGEAFTILCRSLASGQVSLLQTLEVEMKNCFPEEGMEAIGEGMREGRLASLSRFSPTLNAGLFLQGSAVSTFGKSLGSGGCGCLQSLELEWSEVGDEGMGGLAEGLGGGGLSSLRDVSLRVHFKVKILDEGEGKWGGEGCIRLGEVLSTGKLPSLRNVNLRWHCNESFGYLCEGLSRGRVDPPVMVDIDLRGMGEKRDGEITRLSEVIRAGKLSGLRKVSFGSMNQILSGEGGGVFGEALTHAEASVKSLEEIDMHCQSEEAFWAFLDGLSSGPGILPALRTIKGPYSLHPALLLCALVSGGKVPSLKDLTVNLWGIREEGMQKVTTALTSPHVSALRRLEVKFRSVTPETAAANVQNLMMLNVPTSRNLCRLEVLEIEGLSVIEEVRALCAGLGSGHLIYLCSLKLFDCTLEVEGARSLSEVVVAEKLPSLRALELDAALDSAGLTDAGVRALIEGWMSRSPPPLRSLHLQNNDLTDAIVDAVSTFLESQRMSSLETVKLWPNQIGEAAKKKICEAFPEIDF